MRRIALLFLASLLAGCDTDDVRLHGTWRSNRDATVAAAFAHDPRWTNATPERIDRFRDMFGHLTVSYSGNTITTSYDGETNSFGYRVVSRGSDFVAMRVDKGLDKDRRIHLRFVEGGSAYWIDLGPLSLGIEEKFDRLTTESGTPQR